MAWQCMTLTNITRGTRESWGKIHWEFSLIPPVQREANWEAKNYVPEKNWTDKFLRGQKTLPTFYRLPVRGQEWPLLSLQTRKKAERRIKQFSTLQDCKQRRKVMALRPSENKPGNNGIREASVKFFSTQPTPYQRGENQQ